MSEKEKSRVWLVKFKERNGIKGYGILLTGDMKILAYEA